ncbi:MAG: SUMF1/EgtB/PvdO family nonheme iron enzyme [Myxococcales bacterium]|nr:SUMF1/EgtB/PvdO family nonheme iron enzyme [Myxococcales bacterium]MCB9578842.1 SUMF1/EgtB/PvdO family nonheme iron enzyme [Polyangiaceae bacterium]
MRRYLTVTLAGLALAAACGGSNAAKDGGLGAAPNGGSDGGGAAAAEPGGSGAAPGGGGTAPAPDGGGTAGATGGGGTAGQTGQCETGSAGTAGSFFTPNTAFCQGRTPMIADVKGFPAQKPKCSGATPYCTVVDCDATTDPLFCCGGKTPICQSCPQGMVSVGTYCIDQFEVTRAGFAAFLATNPAPPGSCSLAPDADCMKHPEVCQGDCDQHPQVCVPACVAFWFCSLTGKQECTAEQLASACGTSSYPYGATYEPTACNGVDAGKATTAPVGSFAKCASSALGAQPFDLSGNVSEWGVVGPSQYEALGGSFVGDQDALACGAKAPGTNGNPSSHIGFRCCTPD